MRNVKIVGSVVLMCIAVGCAAPAAPSAPAYVPVHDGIQATFAGDPGGRIVWLCATEPRAYSLPGGSVRWEEDHYLQYEKCPATLVK